MPNIQSAKKRLRQNVKQRLNNRSRKSAIRTYAKKMDTAIEAKDFGEAENMLREVQARLDKAAKGATIHPNKAARRKSRLQKQFNALKAKKG